MAAGLPNGVVKMRRTTLFGLVLLALSLSAPGALIYVSKEAAGTYQTQLGGHARGSERGKNNVWLTTPAFSIIDSAGENRIFVAALKMGNRSEATRVCRWMPIVRDRIQTVVSGVDRRIADQETPTLSIEKRRLKIELGDVLETGVPMVVDFVDAKVEPGTILHGGESVVCDGGTLDRRRTALSF